MALGDGTTFSSSRRERNCLEQCRCAEAIGARWHGPGAGKVCGVNPDCSLPLRVLRNRLSQLVTLPISRGVSAS